MSIQILTGDCRSTLAGLPEKSVQCCVTSPPYFGLRDYKVAGQIGLEPTPEEYVREMVSVFSAVKRVLKDDGVLWLNLGDSYARNGGTDKSPSVTARVGSTISTKDQMPDRKQRAPSGIKEKNLIGIPWMVAFALRADGWYLRAACPWIKRNGMPDSTQDRPTQCVETVFMLTKSKKCYYDSEAVKVAVKGTGGGNFSKKYAAEQPKHGAMTMERPAETGKRLRRTSDWFFESWQGLLLDSDDEPSAFVVNLKGYKEAHFATFPPKLVEPCILAATSEKGECLECGKAWERELNCVHEGRDWRNDPIKPKGIPGELTGEGGNKRGQSSAHLGDTKRYETTGWRPQCQCGKDPIPQTVLDPFGGSGTTGLVAKQFGRSAILCELNPDYVALAEKRCGISQPICLDE